jgi:nucleoid DNA-binding protein
MKYSYTRNDLAADLSVRSNLTVKQARAAVNHMLSALADTLVAGKLVEFRNFGVFRMVVRQPKVGCNPQHPEAGRYAIPARRVVRFKAGKVLHEQLNP